MDKKSSSYFTPRALDQKSWLINRHDYWSCRQ